MKTSDYNFDLWVLQCVKSVQTLGKSQLFNSNKGKYGPEKTTYLDTFHAVLNIIYCALFTVYNQDQMVLFTRFMSKGSLIRVPKLQNDKV